MTARSKSKMVGAARLLASDKPGEAFAAIAAIDRMLPEGQTLAGVVEAALTAIPPPQRFGVVPAPPWPVHCGQADACLGILDLDEWQRSFLVGIRRTFRISDKQRATLASLYSRAVDASYARR